MQETIGLYLHIPFCRQKCPYCDFYSFAADSEIPERYVRALQEHIRSWAQRYPTTVDTVYFGGGTPSLLAGGQISAILDTVASAFTLTADAEITLECNPAQASKSFDFSVCGANRVSLGLQSALDAERRILGRPDGTTAVTQAIARIHAAGIHNISLDVMLGIPGQTIETLQQTLHYCVQQDITHISAYLLKIEPGTPFHLQQDTLHLPDEDTVCNMYQSTCCYLEDAGFTQYEISNFSKPGKESRHNLKYWDLRPYLGIGPAAHSFLDGQRFYYPRNLDAFLAKKAPTMDGKGGDFTEYAMLRLRLSAGLTHAEAQKRFGHGIPEKLLHDAMPFAEQSLLQITPQGMHLTPAGFLLSNQIIGILLQNL